MENSTEDEAREVVRVNRTSLEIRADLRSIIGMRVFVRVFVCACSCVCSCARVRVRVFVCELVAFEPASVSVCFFACHNFFGEVLIPS